jgi:hypothetical protein
MPISKRHMRRRFATLKSGVEGLRLGVGFPFLLLALVLAEAHVPARTFFVGLLDFAGRSLDADNRVSATRPESQPQPRFPSERASIEPMGWRGQAQSAPVGFTAVALSATLVPFLPATGMPADIRPAEVAPAAARPLPYRSQAPPV